MKLAVAAAALLLAGCGVIDGEVRDAANGKPIAGAVVRVSTIGWGKRDGELVKDAENVHETRTDAEGKFRFDGIDGGIRLAVRSAAGSLDDGSLCPGSPMIVRVGGPFAGLRADKTLTFGNKESLTDPHALPAEKAGIRASGAALNDGLGILRLSASGGVAFIEGTGAIPAIPADAAFAPSREVDLANRCGWFFVRSRGEFIVIEAKPMTIAQDAGMAPYAIMQFTRLPRA